jgi:hypothetical protein
MTIAKTMMMQRCGALIPRGIENDPWYKSLFCARPPRHPRARYQKTWAMSHRPGLLVLTKDIGSAIEPRAVSARQIIYLKLCTKALQRLI